MVRVPMIQSRHTVLALPVLVVIAVLFMAAAVPSPAADRRSYAEAPMRVVTEGMTAEEHVQQELELSQRLLAELPATAAESAVRIPLTPEEVSAVDRALRPSVPLKIGVVKAMAPGIEVYGLTRGASDRRPTRGKSGTAMPTRDGGLVWAAVVTSENAGAIRLHVEDMSLPRNVELYLYSRSGEANSTRATRVRVDPGRPTRPSTGHLRFTSPRCSRSSIPDGGSATRTIPSRRAFGRSLRKPVRCRNP
jgi:hypothetical protein